MTTYYSEEHEWITVEGDIATIGITAHAAEQLGDIVFVDQKEEGDEFESGDEIGVIESVNENPEADAWIYKVKLSDPSQLEGLMDLAGYKTFIS